MKAIIGKIISQKQPTTIIVEIERFFKHPIYEKRIRRTKKYHVHTTRQHTIGEVVSFIPTRPLSATKRWIVVGEEKVANVAKVVKVAVPKKKGAK